MVTSKDYNMERGEKSNFTVEKPNKHDLSQEIKVNTSCNQLYGYEVPLIRCDDNCTWPLFSSSQKALMPV